MIGELLTGTARTNLQYVSPLHPALHPLSSASTRRSTESIMQCVEQVKNATSIIVHCRTEEHIRLLSRLDEMANPMSPVIALCDPTSAGGIACLMGGADFVYAPPITMATVQASQRAYRKRRLQTPTLTPQTPGAPNSTGSVQRRPMDTAVEETVVQFGPLTLRPSTFTVEVNGAVTELSERPFQLLRYMIQREGMCCTRMEVIEDVWNLTFDPGTNIVDVQVYTLRQMLEPHDLHSMIQTVRGRGYSLHWSEEE